MSRYLSAFGAKRTLAVASSRSFSPLLTQSGHHQTIAGLGGAITSIQNDSDFPRGPAPNIAVAYRLGGGNVRMLDLRRREFMSLLRGAAAGAGGPVFY
jgi:hypothetical protein